MLTKGATHFVGALTFSALTGHRAITDMWESAAAFEINHVEYARTLLSSSTHTT